MKKIIKKFVFSILKQSKQKKQKIKNKSFAFFNLVFHPLAQYEHPYSLILSYPFDKIPLCNFGFKS